ncbi:MAG: ABC transporter permease [Acidimicrobiales bacterium]
MRALLAQLRIELTLSLRQGEQLLVALGIPLLLLVFFSTVDVLALPEGVTDPVEFLAPSVLALAVMSSAFVSLAIATGFERQYGVLKRLGVTPLGRPRLLAAKIAAVAVIELVQAAVIVAAAWALGWRPEVSPGALAGAVALGTAAFAGLALVLAGRLRGGLTLALANALYVVLLLIGGIVIPLERLPAGLRAAARLTPAAALSELVHAALGAEGIDTARPWLVLAVWAAVLPAAAAALFQWEER